ncbi:MAG: hypothetical protein GX541_04335, partial [Clostridiales bacterium]|nr:hypothetical protein [Clostridiales bacterium]
MRVYGKANMARVYSFIVTVALLISLVPVTAQLALADDTDMSGEKITYYLKNDVYAGDTGFSDARIAPFNDYTADRPWAYVADSMPAGPSSGGSGLSGVSINAAGMQIGREAFGAYDGDWVALKIKVPAPGRYNAFVKIYGMRNNGIADVHIAPLTVAAQSDIPSVINPDTKIGTVDFYHDTVNFYYTAEVGYVTITAQDYAAGNGEFLLILQTRGKRAGATGHALYIGEFTLDGIEYSTATREYWFKNDIYAGDEGKTDGRLEPYTEYTYSDGQILRPWAYIADSMPPGPSAGGGSLFGANLSTMAMQIGNGAYASQGATPNEWIALKIKVPAPGKYRMTLIYYGISFNGITDIYVAPMTQAALSDIVSVINPLTKAGRVDMYYSSALYQTSTDFGEFAAASSDWEACDGDYLLIFKNAGKRSSSTGYVMYPRKLEISGQTGFGTSGFSIDKDEIYVDETANASVSPMTSTDTAAPAGWTVSYGSSNSDVAEVSSTGVITGKAVGTAFIYAAVT